MATLNIGLKRADTGAAVEPRAVLAWLAGHGYAEALTAHRIAQSATERTLITRIQGSISDPLAHALCEAFGQDCIAQQDYRSGRLIGPRAAEWGDFNPEYFLTFPGAA